MHVFGAAAQLYQPPRQAAAPGFAALIQAGEQVRPPSPQDHPTPWAVQHLLLPLLEGGRSLDTHCVVHRTEDHPLVVSFVRGTFGMNAVHLDHLPALYRPYPEVLGSVLHWLDYASDAVYPVFTPMRALSVLFPWYDMASPQGREAKVWELYHEEHPAPPDEPPPLRSQLGWLRSQGLRNPVDEYAKMRAYLTDQPLEPERLRQRARGCAHFAHYAQPLQALLALAEQLPDMTAQDIASVDQGRFADGSGPGFAAVTFLSRPARLPERVPCAVEHALDDWGELCQNTGFLPHYSVSLQTPEDAARLQRYLALAPRMQRLVQAVLRGLARGREGSRAKAR